MLSEQRIRAVLFYLSLFVFIAGLPFILSYALGYKFNLRTLKFTKTGLIALKTEPSGASIYLDNKLLNAKTPTTIYELLPARYSITLELPGHYSWSNDINVYAGQVRRLENIILFPTRPNIKQLNKEKISAFWVDKDRGRIYYFDSEQNIIYTSDLKGGDFHDIGMIPELTPLPKKWSVSPNGRKLLGFNPFQVLVMDLEAAEGHTMLDSAIILDFSKQRLSEVFWHSDSFHLIVVTDRAIEVIESSPDAVPITLVNLNKRNAPAFYNENEDALYFLDSQRGSDGQLYDNVYRLDLNIKTLPFSNLIKSKDNE